jgi:hypothetical protein
MALSHASINPSINSDNAHTIFTNTDTETEAVNLGPLIAVQHEGVTVITIDTTKIDPIKYIAHHNMTFKDNKIPPHLHTSFLANLPTWLLEHDIERGLLVTEILATGRCKYLVKTTIINQNGITGTVGDDEFIPKIYSQRVLNNAMVADFHDPEHFRKLLANISLQGSVLPPEEQHSFLQAQPVLLTNGTYAFCITINPQLVVTKSTIVKATIKTNRDSFHNSNNQPKTNGHFKNYYVLTYTNNFDMHNTRIIAAIKGSAFEDVTFTSQQVFATLRNARNNDTDTDDDALDFLIQPHLSTFIVGNETHKALMFYVLIIQKHTATQQNISATQNFFSLHMQRPVYITVNNKRSYQMGKTIESVEQWHMPNQVMQTQTALRITGLNELVTTQQILQCLDSATKIDVDCIQKGTHGDYFILLKPDIQRVSFPNDKIFTHHTTSPLRS